MSEKFIIDKDLLKGYPPASTAETPPDSMYLAKRGSCQVVSEVFGAVSEDFEPADVNVAGSFVTITAHGFITGQEVDLSTTDTLPAPLDPGDSPYYLIVLSPNTFQFAETPEDAEAGVFIELEDDGAPGSVNTIDGVALSGASVRLEKSNDGVNWTTVPNCSANITTTTTLMWVIPTIDFKWLRAVKAISAGTADIQLNLVVIGDAT